MNYQTKHFGNFFDDLIKAATTTSQTTVNLAQPVAPPAQDSFFAKNSGLIISSLVLLAMGTTLLILHKKNQKG